MSLIILPHQIYEYKIMQSITRLHSIKQLIIWEHPHYFTKYKYNKKKIILHRSSMKYYYDYLQSKGYKVKYINFNEKYTPKITEKLYIFDPIDKIKIPNVIKLESPNFLVNSTLMKEYREKTDKFFFHYFYTFTKKKLNIIPNIKSKDKLNRESAKSLKNRNIPPPFPNSIINNKSRRIYINESVEYVNKHFSDNPGNTDNFLFPITHKEAVELLKYFILNKFSKFGPYQDAIISDLNDPNGDYLYHSCLSSSLNIGLINPIDVINTIMKYKSKIPINSFEGFIRQLFWREYQRYCYKYFNFKSMNYFGNVKRLTSHWYDGSLNILPVDNCIKKAFSNGYLHHIERLMIIGNYMNLSGISPKHGFRWFMEFSCDSYEWVMYQNVYEMVFYISGGKTMRRPYISSSNYILKMSDYKHGDWCSTWDKKYSDFIKLHYNKLANIGYYRFIKK